MNFTLTREQFHDAAARLQAKGIQVFTREAGSFGGSIRYRGVLVSYYYDGTILTVAVLDYGFFPKSIVNAKIKGWFNQ